jgi:hypothetical protein
MINVSNRNPNVDQIVMIASDVNLSAARATVGEARLVSPRLVRYQCPIPADDKVVLTTDAGEYDIWLRVAAVTMVTRDTGPVAAIQQKSEEPIKIHPPQHRMFAGDSVTMTASDALPPISWHVDQEDGLGFFDEVTGVYKSNEGKTGVAVISVSDQRLQKSTSVIFVV